MSSKDNASDIRDLNNRVTSNKTETDIHEYKIKDILEDLKNFVTLDRFEPVEKIVWTTTFVLITSVVGAVIALVLKR